VSATAVAPAAWAVLQAGQSMAPVPALAAARAREASAALRQSIATEPVVEVAAVAEVLPR
jgi:hypothetical protein